MEDSTIWEIYSAAKRILPLWDRMENREQRRLVTHGNDNNNGDVSLEIEALMENTGSTLDNDGLTAVTPPIFLSMTMTKATASVQSTRETAKSIFREQTTMPTAIVAPNAVQIKARNPPISSSAPSGSPINAGLTSCSNCGTTKTPLWRRDPQGNTLCNACGLFQKLHGTMRPLSLKTDIIRKRNSKRQSISSQGDGYKHPQMSSSLSGSGPGLGSGPGPCVNFIQNSNAISGSVPGSGSGPVAPYISRASSFTTIPSPLGPSFTPPSTNSPLSSSKSKNVPILPKPPRSNPTTPITSYSSPNPNANMNMNMNMTTNMNMNMNTNSVSSSNLNQVSASISSISGGVDIPSQFKRRRGSKLSGSASSSIAGSPMGSPAVSVSMFAPSSTSRHNSLSFNPSSWDPQQHQRTSFSNLSAGIRATTTTAPGTGSPAIDVNDLDWLKFDV